ncbi:hypothetical protein TUM22923_13630 [Polynucleobacter sp. TUM22923]|jgi:hypothetical protein|uniref:SRPBCC family protein n=1 Tax=Polynucleobacter sp. TUM22923 TaxID=3022126 RepID=UPI002573333E|nr:SRPBCC family protein [Polynucleobacter sp. TUM22923]BDX22042.1 hypothetical protein TUM22923_13630 [Polynucleobacter sp. TUM22923]
MKWLLSLLVLIHFSAFAQSTTSSFDVDVDVSRVGKNLKVQASYRLPISLCAAYQFLTDYDGARNIPGIIESKVISRARGKVQVERLIQERILFIPINMRSVVEYSELPNRGLDFEQTSGDNNLYKGTWRLTDEGKKILFQYQSLVEPNSVMPNIVIEYFIENSIQSRFEKMAENAYQFGQKPTLACK